MKFITALFASLALAAVASAAPSSSLRPGPNYRLIKFADDLEPFWLSSEEVEALATTRAIPTRVIASIQNTRPGFFNPSVSFESNLGVGFIDVTDLDEDLFSQDAVLSDVPIPRTPAQQAYTRSLISKVEIGKVKENLETLSSFFTRYYKSATGAQSAQWIFDKVSEYAKSRPGVTVSKFAHSGFDQFSIIAHIPGTSDLSDVVIIGAHQDSINAKNSSARSPGADDDGSGSVTILEAFRVLVNDASFAPSLPVEFHWYAGEEGGLIGSGFVAQAYKAESRAVAGMLQLDMTAYRATSTQAVRVVTDYVDSSLTDFTRTLATTYTPFTLRDSPCGYACSDHASWYRAGYRSSTTFEPQTNPQIHTENDDLPLVDYDLVKDFVAFGISYAVELSYSA